MMASTFTKAREIGDAITAAVSPFRGETSGSVVGETVDCCLKLAPALSNFNYTFQTSKHIPREGFLSLYLFHNSNSKDKNYN